MTSEVSAARQRRDYFEQGCLCVLRGTLKAAPVEMDDAESVTFYERNCLCSRNYLELQGGRLSFGPPEDARPPAAGQ
jgi:hypothetical protein